MKKIIYSILLALPIVALSQNFKFEVGFPKQGTGLTDMESESFENHGKRYTLFNTYSMREGMKLHLQGFNDKNELAVNKKLEVPTEKMLVSIYEGFLTLDNNMVLVKSVFSKDDKKTFVYGHIVNEDGVVSPDKKELLSIPAEKAMNSGNFSCATSPNKKFSVILSEMPFVKETKEKIMVTVLDNNMKTVFSKEFELPYDTKKGPLNTPVVANDGSVYVIKRVMVSKMPDVLTVFSISSNGDSFKENIVKLDDPKKYESHGFGLNSKNELVVSGFYTEDGKVGFGGTKQKGTFSLNVNGKGDLIHYTTSAFEKHYTFLKIRQVLVKDDGKACMITEDYQKRNNSTMGANNQPVYTTEISADNGYVFFFNEKGEFIKTLEFNKSNKSTDDNGIFGSLFGAVCNNKLILVYNDYLYKHDGKKYVVVPPTISWVRIPIIQIIDFNGTIEKTVPMINANVGGKDDVVHLWPLTGYKVNDTKLFFVGNKDNDNFPLILNMQ